MYVEDPEVSAFFKHIHIQSIQFIEEDTHSRCACKYVVHYLISMKPITQLLHVYYTVLMIVSVI